jgi:MFS-type transporter involved in bile tolerance (Atg22 family)
MLVTQFLGIACTGGIVLLDLMPADESTAHLALNMTLYVIAMFLLRAAVMCNNSLLVCFEKDWMTVLSLLANFLGFAINLVGLLILTLWPDKWFFSEPFVGITPENWWTIIFTSVVLFISPITFLSPNGEKVITRPTDPELSVDATQSIDDGISNNNNNNNNNKLKANETFTILPPQRPIDESRWQQMLRVCSEVLQSLWETIAQGHSNFEYRKCWLFLIAYLFFSSTGTVVTIYIGPLFIALYNATLDDVVYLNLFYKIAMLLGVAIGMLYQYLASNVPSLATLALHNTIFMIQAAAIYIAILLGGSELLVELMCYTVGVMYGWNASVARGLFSALVPNEKKSEFMGFYSATTYLAISGVSVINIILGKLDWGTEVLLLAVFGWSAPAYVFLYWLYKTLAAESTMAQA